MGIPSLNSHFFQYSLFRMITMDITSEEGSRSPDLSSEAEREDGREVPTLSTDQLADIARLVAQQVGQRLSTFQTDIFSRPSGSVPLSCPPVSGAAATTPAFTAVSVGERQPVNAECQQ